MGAVVDAVDGFGQMAMGTPTKVVLLACGSFNPITNMHLRMFGKYPCICDYWYHYLILA